ncbi:MAG: endonuclease [Duncaniella sp.]|nr:endonuclease [Duncaniella sp.]
MRHLISQFISAAIGLLIATSAGAEAPAGYYSTCEGKKGAELLSALCNKISTHTNVGYDGLWNVYTTSDVRANGRVWDMYSTKEWVVGQQHCGNYSNVGDCINREHSMPQSWFNEGSPMKSDAFHIYPTDGKVNGQRSNYPYGECAGGTTLASNNGVKALGRLGKSTFAGYSGTVFEPDDEYKGDFARSYFYMAACYNNKISDWKSDMLAGNSYPVFTQWTINLLLKWHRQDPVSPKEINRNEAVYAHQHNRNPFIDHPEMAEHIWGNNTTTGWSENNTPTPIIATPINGSTIDLGLCGIGVGRSINITVKGQNLTSPVTVTTSGSGFSAGRSSIPAAEANSTDGASLTLTYLSSTASTATGSLTLRSGNAQSTVSLTAQAVSGIPALPAQEISETSFVARWVNVDPAGTNYTLHITQNGSSIESYPKAVAASTEQFTVRNLTPGTTYIYKLTSPTGLSSNEVSVTTATPIPSIQFLFDGDLYFTSEPGIPSEPAEIIIDTDNIADPITLSVAAPFQLSSNKQSWSTTLPLADEQERFYMRLYSDTAGTYSTTLSATAGAYEYDDITIEGVCTAAPTFHEGFENPSSLSSYNGGLYKGSACEWNFIHSLVGTDNRDHHSGKQGARLSNKIEDTSGIEMAEPRMHGISTVTFFAKAWSGEEGSLSLEVSTDGGLSWQKVKTFAIGSEAWQECSAAVNTEGLARIRIMRQSGKRISIDDIEMTDYTLSALSELTYHNWDAYSHNGALIVENLSEQPVEIMVSSANGAVWHYGNLTVKTLTLDLPTGVYLVSSEGYTRKVVVK